MLRTLGKEKLGDILRRTREAHEGLCQKQSETVLILSLVTTDEEAKAYAKWLTLSEIAEGYLKQKAKLHWLNVGDGNNAYFHKTTQIRKMRNSIREIVTKEGVVLTNGEDIKAEAESFFKDFFNSHPHGLSGNVNRRASSVT